MPESSGGSRRGGGVRTVAPAALAVDRLPLSTVIPYVIDQLAMARLLRATFSLMLALLPVFATLIGAVVLRQIPTVKAAVGEGAPPGRHGRDHLSAPGPFWPRS